MREFIVNWFQPGEFDFLLINTRLYLTEFRNLFAQEQTSPDPVRRLSYFIKLIIDYCPLDPNNSADVPTFGDEIFHNVISHYGIKVPIFPDF